MLAISGEQPYPGWSRWETVHWMYQVGRCARFFSGTPHALDRGDIVTGGGGLRGGGTRSPSPVSHAPRSPNISPTLSGFLVDGYPKNSPASPAPPRGRGSAWRYQGSSRARGGAGGKPCPGVYQGSSRTRSGVGEQPYSAFLPSIPVHRIVVDIGIGGGGRETGPHPRGEHGPCAFPMPAASNPRRKIVTKNVVIFSERASPPSRRRGALPPSPSSAMS